jgi:hypothetical protein
MTAPIPLRPLSDEELAELGRRLGAGYWITLDADVGRRLLSEVRARRAPVELGRAVVDAEIAQGLSEGLANVIREEMVRCDCETAECPRCVRLMAGLERYAEGLLLAGGPIAFTCAPVPPSGADEKGAGT